MICKKAIKIAMGVGMVLCATASFAERTESFEAALDGNIWSGDITDALVAGTPTEPAVGFPIATSHMQVLNVEGSVICSNETTSAATSATSSISDFLIFIPEPSDELDGEDLGNAKIAIAAGTNWVDETTVKLCLYCKAGTAATADWLEIANVKTSTWVRVTLVFENNRCRVSLDGEPVHNGSGYKTSAADAGSNGAWYNLANVPGGTDRSIASLSFIGCAKLDDVVIKDSFAEDAFPATAVAELEGDETVRYNDLNKWGWTVTDLNGKLGEFVLNTGMTVAQKLECGLDPTTDTKFEPTNVVGKAANVATIKFPCDDPSKTYRYSVAAEGATATLGAVTVENGTATADVTFSNVSGKVITFWLEADKTNAKPTNN